MEQLTTRRNLLRTAAGGSAILLARNASSRPLGANDRINTGVVGLGGRGTYLLKLALHRAEERNDVQIVALCDVFQKRLNAARDLAHARGHEPKVFTLHQELLDHKDLDAVIIATPDHWHAPVTLMAMENGLDVYCEKPMTHTVEEAKEVARKARELNRIVQIGVQGTSWTRWHKVRRDRTVRPSWQDRRGPGHLQP